MSTIGRLRDRVGAGIAREELWAPGDRVAVAVSGGLDSVVLLDLLDRTRGLHGGELSVITVDHRQHPRSAASAAEVGRLAAERGLPCSVALLDLPPGSSEAACRSARYRAFEALDVDRVALAHHRDDQAETVLLAMIRGSGAAGRSAMAPRRGRYVRPLLTVGRAEIQAWARWRGLSWSDDPTNDDHRFLRNRLRAEILPALEGARPGAVKALARASRHARQDESFIQSALDRCYEAALTETGVSAPWVAEGPPALVRRAILRLAPDLGAGHIDAIRRLAQGRGRVLDLPGGRQVRISGDRLRILPVSTGRGVVPSDPDGYEPVS